MSGSSGPVEVMKDFRVLMLLGVALATGLIVRMAGAGQLVTVWDVSTGKLLTATNMPNSVGVVMFSPNGKSLITLGSNGGARIWNICAPLKSLLRHDWTFQIRASQFGFRQYGSQFWSSRSLFLVWNGAEFQISIPQSLLTFAARVLMLAVAVGLLFWLQRKATREVR